MGRFAAHPGAVALLRNMRFVALDTRRPESVIATVAQALAAARTPT